MKITGIITEYNPFHNGHLYQIEQVKKNGADYIVIIMSGNFLQRGTPAILNKWARTTMALSCGADLVIELPSIFATASAQYFARGGVSILDKLGCIDTLSFGCESDDIEMIQKLSDYLWKEPDEYREALQTYLKAGNSFPKARELALTSHLSKEAAAFASSPNNILALEYCIALLERGSDMQIAPVKRLGAGYHTSDLTKDKFPSATAIREFLTDKVGNHSALSPNTLSDALSDYVPHSTLSLITEHFTDLVLQNDFSLLLKYKLLSCGDSSLRHYADVSEDLSDKIYKNLRHYQNFSQFCELLKSKELTYSRINRALTHILLDITQDMYHDRKTNDYAPYARILGFRKDAKPLLSELGKHTAIPLISKLADAANILSGDAFRYLTHDIFCSNLYASVVASKTNSSALNEYTQQIIIL